MNQEPKSILDRIGSENSDDEYQFGDEYQPFGVSRHAVSLNCITKDGNQVGIAWSLFCDARFDPSKGIEVEFTHKILKLQGSHLLKLYHFILANRVTFIAEADRATASLRIEEGEPVVAGIAIEDRIKASPPA